MENYILQILESSTRVIVPDFGAFIVKQRDPLTVVFNEFLQYNDGVMVDTIAKNESISHEDAKKKIDDYVKTITEALNRGESFSVGKLGVIMKGGTGKISLEKELPSQQTVKKEPVKAVESSQPQKKAATTKKKADTAIAAPKEVKTTPKKTAPVKKNAQVEPKEQPVEKSAEKSETVIPSLKEEFNKQEVVEKVHEPTPRQEKELKVPASEPAARSVDTWYTTESEKSARFKRSNIIIWVIIIVVINTIVFGYFIFNDELKGIFSLKEQDTFTTQPVTAEEQPTEQLNQEEPAASEELPAVETPEETPEETQASTTSVKKITPSGLRYYVVAGVFRDENNAINLVDELRHKGYNAEKFGKIGSLYAVSYDVFATKQEADQFLLKIQRETDPEAWIRTVK